MPIIELDPPDEPRETAAATATSATRAHRPHVIARFEDFVWQQVRGEVPALGVEFPVIVDFVSLAVFVRDFQGWRFVALERVPSP